jgi:hypothetical protein
VPDADRLIFFNCPIGSTFSNSIGSTMAFFRQYIAPLFVVLVFVLALVAASARIFLPDDMAAPAPIQEMAPTSRKVSALPFDWVPLVGAPLVGAPLVDPTWGNAV